MKQYLLVLAVLILFASCKKKGATLTEISYGYENRMGTASNSMSILVKKNSFQRTSVTSAFIYQKVVCSASVSDPDWDGLKNNANLYVVAQMNDNYRSCADCEDGETEWLEVKTDDMAKKIMFDYGKAPEQIKYQVERLKQLNESIKDCK